MFDIIWRFRGTGEEFWNILITTEKKRYLYIGSNVN